MEIGGPYKALPNEQKENLIILLNEDVTKYNGWREGGTTVFYFHVESAPTTITG